MASPTRKVKKIRGAKITSQGSRRKRGIRAELRAKIAAVAKVLGVEAPVAGGKNG